MRRVAVRKTAMGMGKAARMWVLARVKDIAFRKTLAADKGRVLSSPDSGSSPLVTIFGHSPALSPQHGKHENYHRRAGSMRLFH